MIVSTQTSVDEVPQFDNGCISLLHLAWSPSTFPNNHYQSHCTYSLDGFTDIYASLSCFIQYVMDLMDADLTDQVRLQLPVCIGMRYGTPPEGMARPLTMHERVNILADVAMKGPILSITSPTHSIGPSESPFEYRSDRFLEQDFVLIIKADGLHEPRCFAERHPTGSVAMQLTMVPKFDLPIIPAQEYIFLVDRSGSMQGDRIETAKKTLVMLLRALPGKGTTFNIFSFGSECDSMSRGSLHYSEAALTRAVRCCSGTFNTLLIDLFVADRLR